MNRNSFLIKSINIVLISFVFIWFWISKGGLSQHIFKILPVYAINSTANWSFEAPSGNGQVPGSWSKTVTTDTSAGIPEVVALTDNTVAYTGTQSVRGRWTSSASNKGWNVTLYQNFTPSATVKAKLRGYYRREWKSNGAGETSKVALELASGTTNGIAGTVVATAFSDSQGGTTGADVNFTTAPNSGTWSSEVTLTGGTAYTIRVRWEGASMDSTEYGGAWIDGIELSTAPSGLAASAPADTSDVSLTWTASTPGSGTNGLHATTPYKIYRSTSSPVTAGNYLATSAINAYTDTTTAGNTTYYYAIADLDTASIESPLSSQVTILTRPSAPTITSASNVKDTTLTVNWTAPPTGASSYKIERCSGAGCSTFSEIATDQNSPSYNDSNLSGGTLYRYRVRATNSSGDGPYSAITEVTTGIVSVNLTSDGIVSYGLIATGESKDTVQLSDTQTVQNNGTLPVIFNIKTSNASGGIAWTIGSSPGNNIFVHEFSTNSGSLWTKFSGPDIYQTLANNIAVTASQGFDLRLTAPSSASDAAQKTIMVTIQAVSQ